MKLAISTGGGDAPGLNAVIRAVVLSAYDRGWECVGIRRGFHGIYDGSGLVTLDPEAVRGITHLGGTILGTTNRGNPFRWPVTQPDGSVIEIDRSPDLIAAFKREKIDALVSIGGDGSLTIAAQLNAMGLPVVGVPKTIDNDLGGTVVTFGFDTAVSFATEALDRLRPTAQSHSRVMVVEMMGRYAGWIAAHAGIAGGASIILIPEIPFNYDSICRKVLAREAEGKRFTLIAVAEGAREQDRDFVTTAATGGTREARLGGIAALVGAEVQKRTGKETRVCVLGHLQRGGIPTTFDRLICTRFGARAVTLIAERRFGRMVALRPPDTSDVPISEAVGQLRTVPIDGDLIATGKALGICWGD